MTRRHVSILISCDLEDDDGDFSLCVADVLRQHAQDIENPHSEVGNRRHGIAWYWDCGREVTVKWAGNYPKMPFWRRWREAWKDWHDGKAQSLQSG